MLFEFGLSIVGLGCEREETVEIPDEELEGMSEEEIEDYVYEAYLEDWMNDQVDCWAIAVEE